MRSTAVAAKDQAYEKVGEATDALKEEAVRVLDRQKKNVAGRVDHAAETAGRIARVLRSAEVERPAGYVELAAAGMDGVARYIEESEVGEILDDAGELAKQYPAVVLGGLFTLGILAGRFIKAAQSPEDRGGASSRQMRRA